MALDKTKLTNGLADIKKVVNISGHYSDAVHDALGHVSDYYDLKGGAQPTHTEFSKGRKIATEYRFD